MKIDLSPPIPDREPSFKTAPRDDDARRDQGRAFDAAIREAKPAPRDEAKPGASAKAANDAPASQTPASVTKTEAGAGRAEETAKPSTDTASEPATDGAPTAESKDAGDQRPLQSLLGLLTQATAPANGGEKASQPDEQAVTRTLIPDGEAQEGESDAAQALSGGKSVRLDVLKMETHFEPHQDGMVLVRSDEAAKAAVADEAKADVSEAATVLAGLVDKKAGKVTSDASAANARSAELRAKTDAVIAKDAVSKESASTQAASGDEASLPVRFDEALARLSGGGSSGGEADDGRRDRRGEARAAAADMPSRVSDPQPTRTLDVGAAALGGAGGLGLATQIADRMLEVLGEPAARPASTSGQDAQEHLRMRAGGAALKTLTIQLKPEHLGTLDVSMRLSEGRLTVELAASRADTAVLLAEDRGALRQLLERAGFSVDDAAITVIAKDIQPNATRAADGSASSGNGDNSGSGASSGQPNRDESPAQNNDRSARRQPDRETASGLREDAPARSRSSTYL